MKYIKVEIADTPLSLAHGLMGRTELAKDAGMLFKFPYPTEARFWGKNTYLPLDVAFIHNGCITAIKKIIPMSTKYVTSDGSCSMAIEANAGFFNQNGIKVGQRIRSDGTKIIFEEL